MDDRWLSLLAPPQIQGEQIQAEGLIPDDSPFFAGHFPGRPVLPGIAILALVQRTLSHLGQQQQVAGFRRVKFRRLAGAGGRFSVVVSGRRSTTGTGGSELSFTVTAAGERVSDGLVIVTNAEEGAG